MTPLQTTGVEVRGRRGGDHVETGATPHRDGGMALRGPRRRGLVRRSMTGKAGFHRFAGSGGEARRSGSGRSHAPGPGAGGTPVPDVAGSPVMVTRCAAGCHDERVDAIRLAVVDDHHVIIESVPDVLARRVDLADDCVQAQTVDDLLQQAREFDVVVLDVRLSDDSVPEDNVRRLRERGWNVVLFTQEPRPAVLGRCLQAGANAAVGKHETLDVLAEAVETAARGEEYLNTEWAAAVEAMRTERVPDLSPREREVLELYATGLPLKSVARRLAIGEETVREHLRRVRRKYAAAGRPADTKTDLYVRAVEDGHLRGPDGT